MTPASMHTIATWLVQHGLSVIPVEPRGKKPTVEWKPYQVARPQADQLAEWFGNGHDSNIGIVCGAVSGVVAIDCDSAEGIAWADKHLPPTPMVTKTAKGEHRFYRHPGGTVRNAVRLRTNHPAVKIDVRGDGGYVVGPGSTHPSGSRYARGGAPWPPISELPVFDPAWIAEPEPANPPARQAAASPRIDDHDNAMRRVRRLLESMPPAIEGQGGDTHTFNVCCTVVRGFNRSDADAMSLLSEWNQRCVPPWTESEIAEKIASAHKYGEESYGARLNAPPPMRYPSPSSEKQALATNEVMGAGIKRTGMATADDGTEGLIQQAPKWPRPLAPHAYIGVVGDIVKALEPETEADPAALLLQLLTMFGNVIGRTAHFRAEADTHYLNLFVTLVGATSKGRKGVSYGRVKALLEPIDPKWGKIGGLSSGEGLIVTVRNPVHEKQAIREHGKVTGYEMVEKHPGVDDKRLLIVEPEFASVLRVMTREGNTLSAIMRQAWDGQELSVITKTSPDKATGAHFSVISHITAEEMRRYLDVTEMANGWGNRFLLCCVKRSKLLPDGGRYVDLKPYENQLRAAIDHAKTAGEMQRDEKARVLWHAVYERLSTGRPGLLGGMTGRGEAQVMRLACLYALADLSRLVRLHHLEAALEVWQYCFASAAYIFGDALGNAVADEILRALRANPKGLTRTEISSDLFGKNRKGTELSQALALLESAKLATCATDQDTGGRPAERWIPLPAHYEINERNEQSPEAAPLSSSNSFNSLPASAAIQPAAGESHRERVEL